MIELTFYGGVEGEIGGNMILLKDKVSEASLLLDCGVNYHRWSTYFNFPFSRPSDHNDLIQCGVIPNIPGLYMEEKQPSPIDCCLISHAHMDHYRYLSVLREGTIVHMPECGHRIAKAVEEVKAYKTFEDKIQERAEHGELTITDFRTGTEIEVGKLSINPIHVDHSIPGSYAFLLYTSSGLVVYSGDFRKHGAHSELTEDFVKTIEDSGEKVKILICEGTNMVRASPTTEEDVKEYTSKIAQKANGLVITDLSQADIDRIRTIHQISQAADRQLVLTKRIANTLLALRKDPVIGRDSQRIIQEGYVYFGVKGKTKRKTRLREKIEKQFKGKQIYAKQIQQKPRKYIFTSSFYHFYDLKDIKPPPGSVYILSASEPFEEEREFDFGRLLNWLDIYGVPMFHIHSSGHAHPFDIREIAKRIKPEILIPIHTNYPTMMKLFLRDLVKNTIIPEKSVTVSI